MKIFKLIKKFGGIIVGAGVGLVIETLIKDNVSTPKSTWKKLLMKVGIMCLSGFVVKKVKASFEEDVDKAEVEFCNTVEEFQKL